MVLQNYKFDVFLSWTGADKVLKNNIKKLLTEAGLSCYDSEVECKGEFRSDYISALQYSKVYLLIMTDNLKNNPNVSGHGSLTEVRKEVSLAMDLEASGDLNVLIFNTSEFFCYKKVFRDMSDKVGWFFYTNTRGFSRIDALSGLDEETERKLVRDTLDFVRARNENNPIISQKPRLGIEDMPITDCENFSGREKEIQEIQEALESGARAIVLSGIGGMGKTTIAKHFVATCKENGLFVCPQIIRIQNSDTGTCSDIMGTVLSSIVFSDIESYRGLSDTEKRQKQEKVLAELPDFVILAVDNFSSLTKEEIDIFLEKTKCRLLLTTRKPIESFDYKKIKQIYVDKLKIDNARELFDKISGGTVDSQSFRTFYEDIIGGHTITLRMVATAIKMHGKSLEEMLDEVESTGCWSENVTYKDSSDNVIKDSVSGILEGLFSISGFENDDGCKSILRTLSIISQGKMLCKDIMEILNLKNRNELIKLADYNWIVFDNEYVSLHPVLSQIANKVLKPTSKNTKECIDFIVKQSQNRNELTYGSLVFIRDGLFFAIKRLAGNDGKLNENLWCEYTEICRLLNDAPTVVSNSKALAGLLSSGDDVTKVKLFADMTTIEASPSKIDILKPYFENKLLSTSDYKLVIRTLSFLATSLPSDMKDTITEIVDKALDSAMEKNDYFSILSLFSIILFSDISNNKLIKKIKTYIQKHKKEKVGSILYIRLLLEMYSAFREKLFDVIGDVFKGTYDYSQNLFTLLPHLLRISYIEKKAKKLSEDDELYPVFQLLHKMIDNYADNDIMDPVLFYKAVNNLHKVQLSNNVTLSNSFDMIKNTLSIIKLMPKSWQGDIQQIVSSDIFDSNNFTIQQYLDYQLSYEINLMLGNNSALDQAQKMLSVEQSMYNEANSNVINAHIRLASCYSAFGDYNKAIKEYNMALCLLLQKGEKSKLIYEICNSVLAIFVSHRINVTQKNARAWFNIGIKNIDAFTNNALTLAINYLSTLQYSKSLSDEKDFLSLEYDNLILKNIKGYLKKNNLGVITAILRCLNNLCTGVVNQHKFICAKNLLKRIEDLRKYTTDKIEIQRITLSVLDLTGYYNMYLGNIDESNVQFDLTLNYGCKHKTNFNNFTSNALWFRFCNIQRDKNIEDFLKNESGDYIEIFSEAFFGKSKLAKKQRRLIENIFSVISIYDGFKCGNSAEKLHLLLKYGNDLAKKNYVDNFGLSEKEWKKCANAKKYKLAFLDYLWGEFSETYKKGNWRHEYYYTKSGDFAQYFVHGKTFVFDKYISNEEIELAKAKSFLINAKKKVDNGFETADSFAKALLDFVMFIQKDTFVELEYYKNILLSSYKNIVYYCNEEQRNGILAFMNRMFEENSKDTPVEAMVNALNKTLEFLTEWFSESPLDS